MWITLVVTENCDISISNGDKAQIGMVIQAKYENVKKESFFKSLVEIIDASFDDAKKE